MPRRAAVAERERGLLIVNADDWGLDTATTNAIHECLAAGAVTSVSAMVHMGDSARAATLPVGPVGLHLNLTTPFTDPRCPELVRRRHDRLIRQFSRPTFQLPGCDPRLFGEIKRSVGDQLAAFRELYGRDPTHVDGHHHVQQSLGVILSRSLPNGVKVRPSFTFMRGEKSAPNRCARALLNRVLRMRLVTPRYFFSIRDLHPALGGRGLEQHLDLARRHSVEVMSHPGWEDEQTVLLGPDWAGVLAERPLGSYADLS